MMIQSMENVGIVVDDLAAARAFFVELGLRPLGEGPVEGEWVDRVVGLEGVRVDVAMLETSDGHGLLELMKAPAGRQPPRQRQWSSRGRIPGCDKSPPKRAPTSTLQMVIRVEVAGIEPASFDVVPVLLRAQPVTFFSGPPLATGTGGGPQSAKFP